MASSPFRAISASVAGCALVAGVMFAAAPAQAAAPAHPTTAVATAATAPVAAAPAATPAAPTVPNTRPAWEGLAPTPPMGYNDWAYFTYNFTEASLLAQAKAMKDDGLVADGYDTLTVDDSWMTKDRDANGNLVVDTAKFPDGMKAFGDKLHAMGMKFGIYADAGTATCGGYAGSLGHEAQDAKQFASWGVDYVKVDGCNLSGKDQYVAAYKAWSSALEKKNSGRAMVFSVSLPTYFEYGDASTWHDMIKLSGDIGNLWREGDDVRYSSYGHDALWASIMNNYHYNVKLPEYAGPGHWNDPDFLIIGANGLTHDEERSQMSLYSEMASPLIMSNDVTVLSPDQLSVLGNKEVIAVDQDPLGAQGYIAQQDSSSDVLVKPLENGDHAVVLFNNSNSPRRITTDLATLGVTGTVALRDLWKHADAGTTSDAISAMVPAHGVVMYRLSPAPQATGPDVRIRASGSVAVGGDGTMTVTVSNAGAGPATDVAVELTAPKGVTLTTGSRLSIPSLAAGASVSVPVGVSASDSATAGTAALTATVTTAAAAPASHALALDVTAAGPHGTDYISDLPWIAQTHISDGPYQRDLQYDGTDKIILDGTTYDKGVGGQPDGSITVALDGKCTTFTATIGIDDFNLQYAETHGQPEVWSTFTLKDQDGTVIKNVDFTGGAADDPGASQVQTLTADVSGVQQLTLANSSFGGHNNYYAHADWANARVECASDPAAAAPTITEQPADASVAAGSDVTLTATASAAAAPDWSWQVSRDGGTSWAPVASAHGTGDADATSTTAKLTTPVAAAETGVRYRAVFTGDGGTVASAPAVVTVTGAPAAQKATLTAALDDGVDAVVPGGHPVYRASATVGDVPATGVSLTLDADAKAPFSGDPIVAVRAADGSDLPFAATVTATTSTVTVTVPGLLPAGAVLEVVQRAAVADGLADGSGAITATAAASAAALAATPAHAVDSDEVSFKAALDNDFTDDTRDVLPGSTTTYVSTTRVDGTGFVHADALAGPAEGVTLTLTPDAALPFSGTPTVSVVDTDGEPVTPAYTIGGDGTAASPYVVRFTEAVPQGVITTTTPAKVPADAAYGTAYTARLSANVANNGRAARPADATDRDTVDNAPTVKNTLTTSATTVKPGDTYDFTASTTVVGGAARGFTMSLYGTLAAPLDDDPTVTVTAADGTAIAATTHVARSETSYTVSVDGIVPANAVVTVAGSATVVAHPQVTDPVGVRQTASALNLGGDPTHIDPKQVGVTLDAPVTPSVPLPAGCAIAPHAAVAATADSQNTVSENTPVGNAIDGDVSTFWSSVWATGTTPYPHAITLDLGAKTTLCGINYVPRQGNHNGRIAGFKVFVGDSPVDYAKGVPTGDGALGTQVASGTMTDSDDVQTVLFDAPVTGRYVTLEGLAEVSSVSTGTMTVGELSVDAMLPSEATLTTSLTAPDSVVQGDAVDYTGTVVVGSDGFAHPDDAVAGPAEDVRLTLTPDADAPLSGAPTVTVRSAGGQVLAVRSLAAADASDATDPAAGGATVGGAGTHADPAVITFADPLPQGATVTVEATATAASDAQGPLTATLSAALSNNGAASDPKAATATTSVTAASGGDQGSGGSGDQGSGGSGDQGSGGTGSGSGDTGSTGSGGQGSGSGDTGSTGSGDAGSGDQGSGSGGTESTGSGGTGSTGSGTGGTGATGTTGSGAHGSTGAAGAGGHATGTGGTAGTAHPTTDGTAHPTTDGSGHAATRHTGTLAVTGGDPAGVLGLGLLLLLIGTGATAVVGAVGRRRRSAR